MGFFADSLLDGDETGGIPRNSPLAKQRRLQTRVLRRLLTRLDMEDQLRTVAYDTVHREGWQGLSLKVFRELCPSFPVFLEARKLAYLGKVPCRSLIRCHALFFRKFDEIINNEFRDRKTLVLVFPWLHGIPLAAFHAWKAPTPRIKRCAVHVFRRRDSLFFLEPFDNLVEAIREVWH